MRIDGVYYEVTQDAIEEIYRTTGEFHDNCINICDCADDVLRLELWNPWGDNIEFVFFR